MMRKWLCTGLLAAVIALPGLGGAARAGGDDDLGCSNATLKGDYAFSVLTIVEAPPGAPGVVVGLGTFDGRGGFTQIDYPGNGATDMNLDEKFRTGQTGSYKVNRNCTGFMTINIVQAGLVIENAIVISNGGRAIHGVVASGTTSSGAATPLQSRVDFWKVASEHDD
jgi:hypothetical protein